MSEQTEARQLVVFTLGSEQYALPIRQVQEIIRYRPTRSVASSDCSVRGVLSLRGRIVPIYDLAGRLGVSSEVTEQSKIVIIDTGADIVGVTVDAVDEVLTVDTEQIEQAPGADAMVIDAIAKIGERLVVLLDPGSVFSGADTVGAVT